jgi:hypothetical protein
MSEKKRVLTQEIKTSRLSEGEDFPLRKKIISTHSLHIKD